MLDGDEEKLKIDQEFLETVIPAIGATVRIVNGKFRGKYGMLESVNIDEFKVNCEPLHLTRLGCRKSW